MGWGYSSYNYAGLPAFESYDQAKKHYESVAPIRGRSVEVKPLGTQRRYWWYQIKRFERSVLEDGNPLGRYEVTYSFCTNNNHTLVEFWRDGSVSLFYRYSCPSDRQFLNNCVRGFGQVESVRGKFYFVSRNGKSYFIKRDKTLVLSKDAEGYYVPKNPEQEFKFKLKRKVWGEVKENYKNFMDFGKGMLSIDPTFKEFKPPMMEATRRMGIYMDDTLYSISDHEIFSSYYGKFAIKRIEERKKFFNALAFSRTNLALQYELAMYFAMGLSTYSYKSNLHSCNPSKFVSKFERMIKIEHARSVFEAEPVEIGKSFHDDNYKYVACAYAEDN